MSDEERTSLKAELDLLRANCGDLMAERLDVLAKLSQPNQAGFDGGSLAGAVAAELTQWREAYEGQREELNVHRSRLQIPLADPDDVKPDQVVVDPANKRVYVSVWMQDSCLLAYLREEYVVDKDLMEAEFPFDSNECKLRDGWLVIRVSAAMFAGAGAAECERLREALAAVGWREITDDERKPDTPRDALVCRFCGCSPLVLGPDHGLGCSKYEPPDTDEMLRRFGYGPPPTEGGSDPLNTPDAIIVEDGGGPIGPDAVTMTFRRGPVAEDAIQTEQGDNAEANRGRVPASDTGGDDGG